MDGACYPLTVLPGLSRLFLAFLGGEADEFYAASSRGEAWMREGSTAVQPLVALADLLSAQNRAFHAGPAALANIAALATGARAVVTGQQVGLFGGPLYTLHKAATTVRLAAEASRTSGVKHVPIFWLASEDHDFPEVDHVGLASSAGSLEVVRLGEHPARSAGSPVGPVRLGHGIEDTLAVAARLLGEGAELELLRRCYRPDASFAGAFAEWLAATFHQEGLIVFDPSGRKAHAFGAEVLRRALTEAETLERLLLERGRALQARGFHEQVLVQPGGSLLFLLSGGAANQPHTRLPLKRTSDGGWTAGDEKYSTEALLRILAVEPERLSPNALLRPVFQDAILPTAAYIGGPAEIAYFAQTAVLHQHLLGRETAVLPRLSATLLTARQARIMEGDALDLPDIFHLPTEELAQRLGLRGMPAEGKQRLHAAGAAMTAELEALTAWLRGMDPDLGRPAEVAANKMRHQMNRLRRLAARRELERDASIRRRAETLRSAVFPQGHLQERALGASAALARFGPGLPGALVAAAANSCPGHKLLVF